MPPLQPLALFTVGGAVTRSAHAVGDSAAFVYHDTPGSSRGRVVEGRAVTGALPHGREAAKLLERAADEIDQVAALAVRPGTELCGAQEYPDVADWHGGYWCACRRLTTHPAARAYDMDEVDDVR